MRWDFFDSGHSKDKTFLKFVSRTTVFASFLEICSYSLDEVYRQNLFLTNCFFVYYKGVGWYRCCNQDRSQK